MYFDRSSEIFTECRRQAVSNLWRSVIVNFTDPIKAILSTLQSSPLIVGICGLEVTLALLQCQIHAV